MSLTGSKNEIIIYSPAWGVNNFLVEKGLGYTYSAIVNVYEIKMGPNSWETSDKPELFGPILDPDTKKNLTNSAACLFLTPVALSRKI